jgi:hypothetical protein
VGGARLSSEGVISYCQIIRGEELSVWKRSREVLTRLGTVQAGASRIFGTFLVPALPALVLAKLRQKGCGNEKNCKKELNRLKRSFINQKDKKKW